MQFEQDVVLAEVYAELRSAAARMLRRDAPNLTLQPTELLHDAVMRILQQGRVDYNDRQHFLSSAAWLMRRAMIDAVRRRRSAKRTPPTMLAGLPEDAAPAIDIELIDAAIDKLALVSPDLARLVELRYFGGLTVEEAALALDISEATLKRRWRTARMWLATELQDAE